MNLYAARYLACRLLKEHGLHEWGFAFDHARRRFGCCRFQLKRITLSRPLTFLNSEEQVRETILHEIAHALTPGDGHGVKWKAVCRRIGAKPVRCYREEQVVAPPRRPAQYRMGCPRCNWWADRRRRTNRELICRMCRGPVVCEMAKLDAPTFRS